MKASLFVYTRTYYTDFHVLFKPKRHEEYLVEYTDLAEKLVANYDVNKETQPLWVYLRFGNSILWGIVCANSCLGNKFSDKSSRLVRGFFGIVVSIKDGFRLLLPNDLDFFADLYKQNINQVWETRSYNSFEYEFELEKFSKTKPFDIVKEIDSLKTLNNYVVMSDIDEYCEFLNKRNAEKRKKREIEIGRLRQEERRRELERSAEDCYVQETPSCQGKQAEANEFLKVFRKGATFLAVGLASLWLWGGLSSPKQKPAPQSGFVYCINCHGTGYNYKYLWGIFSSECSTCWGSGYVPQITPSIPGRIDSTPFGQSELQYKGKKCGIVMEDGKYCRCPGCEPGHKDPFICTQTGCGHKCKDHNR